MLNNSGRESFKTYETSLIATVVFIELLAAIVGCIGNLCVIVVFFKQKKWNGATAVYTVNLAVTDLLICSIMMPLSVARVFLFPDITTAFHIAHESLLSCLRSTAIATLVVISYDRMASATRPLRIQTSSARKIICGIWTSSIPSLLLPIFAIRSKSFHIERKFDRTVEVFRVWNTCVFAVLCLIMFYNYRSVQSAAKHRAANLPIMILQQTMPLGSPDVGTLSSQINQQKKKVVNLCRMIMSSVLLSWTPYLGLSFATFFIGSSQPIERATVILLALGYLSHVLHPFLYALPSSNWREAAVKTFPFLNSSQSSSVNNSVVNRQRRVAPT